MKSLISKLAAVSMAFVTSLASAISCDGVPVTLGIGQGDVLVSIGAYPIHVICNVQTQGSYTLTTEACKQIYSSLVLAKATGNSVSLYYTTTSYTCASIPSWSAMTTFYYYVDY